VTRVVVSIRGGFVHDVIADGEVELLVVDFDGVDDERLVRVPTSTAHEDAELQRTAVSLNPYEVEQLFALAD
jgi:hypothetical protein